MITFDYLTREFLPKVIENINDTEDSVGNQGIDNFSYLFIACAKYATGNIEDDSVSPEEYPARIEIIRNLLDEVQVKLAQKFNLEIKVDSYEELKKVYELFVINRINTIANVLDHAWEKDEDIPEDLSNQDVLNIIFNTFDSNISLATIMEYYYMEELLFYHDKVFFETPRQTFYESFFFGETITFETLRDYPDMINAVTTIVTKRKLQSSIKRNKKSQI